MDEQRVREIIREELAEFMKSIQPTFVKLTPEMQLVNADAFALERFQARLTASKSPDKPWG